MEAEGFIPRSHDAEASKPKLPTGSAPVRSHSGHSQAREHPRSTTSYSEPECIDVDALSDSESKPSESECRTPKPKPGPLEDNELTRTTSAICCCSHNRTQNPKLPRAEPEHIGVDALSDSESKFVTLKPETLEDTKPPTSASSYARTRKRYRPKPHIDIDALSDFELKSTDFELKSTDIKPEPIDIKRKPRGSRFKTGIMMDASTGELIDNDIVYLGCFQVVRTLTSIFAHL